MKVIHVRIRVPAIFANIFRRDAMSDVFLRLALRYHENCRQGQTLTFFLLQLRRSFGSMYSRVATRAAGRSLNFGACRDISDEVSNKCNNPRGIL